MAMYKTINIGKNIYIKLWSLRRNIGMQNMRNIVILKDLPSNMIEEAFVVLKENSKIKNFQLVDNKFKDNNNINDGDDFVVKEAEMLIANYINDVEKNDMKVVNMSLDLDKKYKKMKWVTLALGVCLAIAIFI